MLEQGNVGFNKIDSGSIELTGNNNNDGDGGGNDDDEEAEEIPEDLAHLSPEEQQRRIRTRAFTMLFIGTAICFIISDPMVDVFTEVAKRINVNSFYVTFLLAPLASNATELIAAYNYAQKKTSKSITISLSTLLGAACLNNTFSLGIFLFIIWYKQIVSSYFAEFAAILVVQGALWVACNYKKIHTLWDGVIIICLFPASLVVVAILEMFGWK